MSTAGLRREIETRLRPGAPGRPLFVFDRAASTMDEARVLARAGASPGTTVIALGQTAGRGRLDRPFVSPEGGLYMTVVLRPPGDPADAWRCGFAAALAARDAIVAVGGPAVEFDWPNDLVLGDRKVGGILMELLTSAEGGTGAVPVLLLGIGLNLGPDPRATEPAAAGPAGPVTGLPGGDHRGAVAASLLEGLGELLPACGTTAGWRAVLDQVRAFSRAARGAHIEIRTTEGRLLSGSGIGLRDDGALELRVDDGTVVAIRYGERVDVSR